MKKSAWVVPYFYPKNKVLIAKRSKKVNNGGLWNFFGGTIDKGESPIKSAKREFFEEAGIRVQKKALVRIGVTSLTTKSSRYEMHYFALLTEDKFKPIMNKENSDYKWVVLDLSLIHI